MSARRLPRELGVVIRCNAARCEAKFQTGNIRIKVNRIAAAALGWMKGALRGMRRFDYCPRHAKKHRALIAERNRQREERRKARDAARRESRA